MDDVLLPGDKHKIVKGVEKNLNIIQKCILNELDFKLSYIIFFF